MTPTPAYLRRASLGQFREHELLSGRRMLWTALGFFIAAGILIFAAGCKASCAQLTQAKELACASGSAAACEAATQALAAAYPQGCPTPPPTTTTTTTPGPEPTVPPVPEAPCLPDQAGWVAGPSQVAVYVDKTGSGVLKTAVETYKREHPEEFTDNGTRLANLSAAGVDRFYDGLGAVAARSAICGGHVRENGSRIDKFGMLRPDGAVEVYHLVDYGGFRLQSPIKVNSVWVPNLSIPPAPRCPAPRPEQYRNPATKQDCTWSWGITVGRKWIDATLTVTRCCAFCKDIGMGDYGGVQRCSCPLRPEGNPERGICEDEVGYVWSVRGGQPVPNPDNPAQVNCEGVGCQVRVCTKDSSACSEWKP